MDFQEGPVVNFAQLKCAMCKKNLSVPPIYTAVSSSCSGDFSVCGRCLVPPTGYFIRNKTFEMVAERLEFPCCFSESCGKKSGWKDTFHEQVCPYRPAQCPICPQTMPVNAITEHYRKKHIDKLYEGGSVVISGNLRQFPYPHHGLLIVNDLLYIIDLSRTSSLNEPSRSAEIVISLKALRCRPDIKNKRLSITYSYQNEAISYQNFSETSFSKLINICHVKAGLGCDIDSEVKLEISVRYENTNELNIRKEMYQISSLLNCPVCMEMIAEKVVICRNGHSICLNCKTHAQRCPICFSPFHKARNFLLEEIRKRIKKFL